MKKILTSIFAIVIGINAFAQNVSINDNGAAADANAILDIDISTNNKGILIPRLTTAQIAAMGAVTNGMLVFNETIGDFQFYTGSDWSIAGKGNDKEQATAAPTINDDGSEGYMVGSFWHDVTNDKAYICLDKTDGAAVWKEITYTNNSSNGIYSGNGTTPAATTITITDNINFDANTLFVDGTNNRVGVGTSSPLSSFHTKGVDLGGTAGDVAYPFQIQVNAANSNYLRADLRRHTTGADWAGTHWRMQKIVDVTPHGFIDFGIDALTSNAGIGIGTGTTTHMVVESSGSVGIGTSTPVEKLDVQGNVQANSYHSEAPEAVDAQGGYFM